MRILHVSTFERAGGAAIAASRLHLGLRELGHSSTLIVRHRTPDAPVGGVVVCPGDQCGPAGNALVERLLSVVYSDLRLPGDESLFSTDQPTLDLAAIAAVREADIINVHWASGLLSTAAMRRLHDLGKPIVWTLHDQFAFTGGCHYSGDCVGYAHGCEACPRLRPGARHVPALVLARKRRWLDAARLAVVCPSAWLAQCARRSLLLRDAPVRTIPNSVPVAEYQQVPREEARRRLALPAHSVVVLIGSDRLDEPRKGHAQLVAALGILAGDQALQPLLARRGIVCAAFGGGQLTGAGLPILSLGRLTGEHEVAMAYRAADLFVLPTLEDNLPNTLLESVAAGTPVVACAVGGVPDILRNPGLGVLVPPGDVPALAAAIRSLVADPERRARMREACEAFAREHLNLSVQAAAYLRVYAELRVRAQGLGPVAAPGDDATGEAFAHAVAASDAALVHGILSRDLVVELLDAILPPPSSFTSGPRVA